MQNTKKVAIEKLSDDSLENISRGMIGDVGYFLMMAYFQAILRISASGLLKYVVVPEL